MAPHHLAFITLICLLWGLNFVVGKIGLAQFDPILFSSLRFVLLAVLLAPFLRWHKGQMRAILMVCLLAGAIHFALTFSALAIAGASVLGIVAQLHVPFLTVLSILFLGEIVGWRRWTGMGLAFAGVAIIGFDSAIVHQLPGVGLMALGAFCYASAVIFMRKLNGVGPMELQAWVALISAPSLTVMSLMTESGQWAQIQAADLTGWSTVLYTCIGASIIGHGGLYYLIQRYEASLVGSLTLMAPIFALIAGVTLLGEPFTLRIAMGGVLTILGVLIIALRSGKAPEAAPIAKAEAVAPD